MKELKINFYDFQRIFDLPQVILMEFSLKIHNYYGYPAVKLSNLQIAVINQKFTISYQKDTQSYHQNQAKQSASNLNSQLSQKLTSKVRTSLLK